jgi:soluble lytic murein transglycosylase-like protein
MKISLTASLLVGSTFVLGSAFFLNLSNNRGSSSAPPANVPAVNNIESALRGFTSWPAFGKTRSDLGPDAKANPGAEPSKNQVLLSLAEIEDLIRSAALKHQVSAAFVKSIIAAESNFNPNAVSMRGAIGLMQLMPDTARQFGADPAIPAQNIEAGTRYLKFLINKYRRSRNPLSSAIAAYNAGPGAVDRYRGVPPFRETRGYVVRVRAYLQRFSNARSSGA